MLSEPDARLLGWAAILFIGLCLCVFAFQLAAPSRLILDAEGLTITTLGRRSRIAWAEIEAFGATQLPTPGAGRLWR